MKKPWDKKVFAFLKSCDMNLFFIIFTLFVFLPFNIQPIFAYDESSGIQVDLGVDGCNNNGVCEPPVETVLNCPSDCTITPPINPPAGGGGKFVYPEDLYIYNIHISPEFTNATISWRSNVGSMSSVRWGETTEVKEGTIQGVIFEIDHKVQLINLKSGTMYYFIIESKNASGKIVASTPIYFFTKFKKDTAFPLNPTNVKSYADISGIHISWKNPPDPNFSYIRIMRHEDRLRSNPFLGKLIYEGKGEKFSDSNVVAGKKYFYTLFARNINGEFSSGVGISQIAYSAKKIPPEKKPETKPETIPKEKPEQKPIVEKPILPIKLENFFAHQYNQLVELLEDKKNIPIDGKENTVIDTNEKTFDDDWMEVRGAGGESVGQYLFSFNKDSGRYQAVIPPLSKEGIYNLEIHRYKNDGTSDIISQGSLLVQKSTVPIIEKTEKITLFSYLKNFLKDNLYWLLIILLFILLILVFSSFKRKEETQEKQG